MVRQKQWLCQKNNKQKRNNSKEGWVLESESEQFLLRGKWYRSHSPTWFQKVIQLLSLTKSWKEIFSNNGGGRIWWVITKLLSLTKILKSDILEQWCRIWWVSNKVCLLDALLKLYFTLLYSTQIVPTWTSHCRVCFNFSKWNIFSSNSLAVWSCEHTAKVLLIILCSLKM